VELADGVSITGWDRDLGGSSFPVCEGEELVGLVVAACRVVDGGERLESLEQCAPVPEGRGRQNSSVGIIGGLIELSGSHVRSGQKVQSLELSFAVTGCAPVNQSCLSGGAGSVRVVAEGAESGALSEGQADHVRIAVASKL
jgi:hypothetical protein